MTKQEKREMLKQIVAAAESAEIVTGKLLKNASRIALYGAGNYGRQILASLNEMGFKAEMFIDKRADALKEYCGLPVYKIDDISEKDRKDLTVIVSFLMTIDGFNDFRDWLKSNGFAKVLNPQRLDLLSEFSANKGISISQNVEPILEAFDLMNDEISEDVFFEVCKAHAKLTHAELPILNPDMTQYVDVKVPFKNNYRSFVDCGAFTGDTLESLALHHKVKNYFGFEPDPVSYAKLSEMTDSLSGRIGTAICFPLGVSDKNEFLRFSSGGGGSSKISDTGEEIIQVVRLDDVLKGYDDLLIKMDVEGAEIAALNGARNIIMRTKPDLAISVYHKFFDLWEIPLMLKKWIPEYKFYMRSHYDYTLDTVLYTTI